MPIYEYRCSTCGYENEYLQKVSDPRLTDCPECGKPTFDKLVSAAGFHLKGSGWYVTDFKNSGAKPKAAKEVGDKKSESGDKPKSQSGEKPESQSGDNKPAAQAEPKKEDKPEPSRGTGAAPACT